MKKIILSEQSIYYGEVDMPKGWDIDREQLSQDILRSNINESQFPFSRNWDMLNTYIREYVNLEFNFQLINKDTWGNIYKPSELSEPLFQVDPVDLKNSPDFILLYGVKVQDCEVRIYYDDNRRKGRSWDIPLTDNKFIFFPATNLYHISNNQKENLNFILNTSYEYI